MKRMSLAAAAVLTLGLLAPAATAVAAPKHSCAAKVLVKAHKQNDQAKKNGHTKAKFVHAGKVTAVDATASTLTFTVRGGQNKALRGCAMTVKITADTKMKRNDAPSTMSAIKAGDHVNVKGVSDLNLVTKSLSYTAKRVSAQGPGVKPAP